MKTETIEEFLARGGKPQIIEKVIPNLSQRVTLNPKNQSLMSLDEGAHYFSEIKAKRIRRSKNKTR
jgi:hypothetical protein